MTTIKVQGTKFVQGERTVYALAPTIGQMLQIIPERANPDVIQDANRRLYIPHGKGFGDYVLTEPKWISGSLMAGITEDAIEWNDNTHRASIVIEQAQVSTRLFDGQHRRYGIDYAIRRTQAEIDSLSARMDASDEPDLLVAQIQAAQMWIEHLLEQTIPLLMYVEADLPALQQMYADVSHIRVPDAVTVATFNKRDPFNAAALELAETHEALKGLVDMERNTLARASGALVALPQLASVLRVLFAGIGGRTTAEVRTLTARPIVERGRAFFDDMLETSDALRAVSQGEVSASDVRERGELSINVTILKVMAATWRELTIIEQAPRPEVVDYLSALPHETPAAAGSVYVKAGLLQAGIEKPTPMGRSQELRKAVQLVAEGYEEEHPRAA